MIWPILPIAMLQAASVALALFALSDAAARLLRLAPWRALLAGLIALGLAGFLQFWAAFFSPALIRPLQLAFLAAILALTALAFLRRNTTTRELLAPCLAVFAASVFLIWWSFNGAAPADLDQPLNFMTTRWTSNMSTDNEIPWVFADQLRQGGISTPFYGDWLSSDRPPLQTGLYLLLNTGPADRLWYQARATALQLTSLAAIWSLASAAGLDRRWALYAAAAVFLTPLTIANGAYVWPKMLAAAFVAAVFALHFFSDRERPWLGGALAGLAAALAMLAHGSSAFALIGVIIAALAVRLIGQPRYVLAGAACAAALYAPWVAYQRFVDPPGDRLMKWHLAGFVNPATETLPEALALAYGTLTPRTWADGRLRNLAGIAGVPNPPDMPGVPNDGPRAKARNIAFSLVGATMGVFGLALYLSPGLVIPRATRALGAAAIATLLVWALLIFGGGQTMAKNGSYFPQLVLILATVMLLATKSWGRNTILAVLAVQAFLLAALYAVI